MKGIETLLLRLFSVYIKALAVGITFRTMANLCRSVEPLLVSLTPTMVPVLWHTKQLVGLSESCVCQHT